MAYRYVPVDRDQLFLLPSSLRDWLPEGHLAWFVLDVVAKVDTSAFHARHPNDGVGRPAYDPEMMLALLVYAYCTKVRSSRRIEQLCESDVAYRVICANLVPDHGTIARFVVDHETAIKGLFVDVLVLCAAAGLTTLGSIAIDGTKMGADAALDANRSAEAVRAEVARIVAEARGIDAADDARLGAARGDELPAELASPLSRLARLERALTELAELEGPAQAEAQARAARQAAQAVAAAQGRKPMGRRPKDPQAALAWAEANLVVVTSRAQAKAARRAARAAAAAGQGRKPMGRRPKDPDETLPVAGAEAHLAQVQAAADTAVPAAPAQVNVTDPDSRIMKTPGGWLQGYNAQAAVNDAQVVLACEITQDTNDVRRLVPMMRAAADNVVAAGITSPIGMVLADAGYWSDHNATAAGPDRLIATVKDWKQRQAARRLGVTTGPPPPGATPLEAMEHRLRTPEGTALYARRSCTVEPVFGDHKENRGFRRFMRRGFDAVTSEWSLINTTHNILKLYRAYPQPT
jgi:transposase